MDTNNRLIQHLILTLTSDAGDLDSASPEWARRAHGPKPKRSLCLQTAFLTLLANKTSRLGILEPQCSPLPAHQTKNVALRGYPPKT